MSNKNMTQCKACNKDIAKGVKKCPNCGKDQRNFFMRHKILTGIIIILLIALFSPTGEDEEVKVADDNKVVEDATAEDIADGKEEKVEETTEVEEEVKEEKEEVPREHRSALKKAETYASMMHMSKAGIYDQLVSEHGEAFPAEAAQYAIDNLEADWKENALKKAETYAEDMSMSDSAVYDQLISEYGEQFTKEEAQYAIDNLAQ